jgi:hypothetical protein
MSSEALAYSERRITPAYGDGQLAYEAPGEVEEQLDGLTHGSLALAIFIPVAAAYGALAYGLYLASDAIF